MKLLFTIEYRTRWGEQLVLRLGKRRIALQYADGGVWACAVERYAPAAQPAEYRYKVEREGVCIRSEWRPHTLRIPSREGVRTLRIRDRWQEMPSDTPFYSSAFTRGIFGRGKTGNPKKAAGNITLRVILPTLRPDETLAVAGSGRELGDWKRIVPMDDSRFPEWELTLHTAHRFEYKFLIADRKTLTPILWEEGANRTWGELPGAGEHALDAAAYPRFPERRWQGAGTAIPVFSLRTEEDFGVGEFYDLKRLIDWAAATGQCVIQVLPINDTTMTGTWEDSYPYNANSTFALHPQFIRLPALFEFTFWYKLKWALQNGIGCYFVKDILDVQPLYAQYRSDYIEATKLSNHDEDRTGSDLGQSAEKMKVAAAVLLTAQGAPYIYQGEELGYWGTKSNGDEYVRTPILWDKAGNELASGSLSGKIDMQMLTPAISVEAQADDDGSLLNLYRTFARLRNTYPVLAQGKMVKHPVYNDGNTSQQSIAAWYRELDGERMLVVHNFGREEQILTLTDQPDKAVGVSGEVKLQRGDASSKLLMGAWSSVVFTL